MCPGLLCHGLRVMRLQDSTAVDTISTGFASGYCRFQSTHQSTDGQTHQLYVHTSDAPCELTRAVKGINSCAIAGFMLCLHILRDCSGCPSHTLTDHEDACMCTCTCTCRYAADPTPHLWGVQLAHCTIGLSAVSGFWRSRPCRCCCCCNPHCCCLLPPGYCWWDSGVSTAA